MAAQTVKILLKVTGEFADSALPSEDMKRAALDREFYTLDLSITDEVKNLFEASLREALDDEMLEVDYSVSRIPTLDDGEFTEAITVTLMVTPTVSVVSVNPARITQIIQENISTFEQNLSKGGAYDGKDVDAYGDGNPALTGAAGIVATLIQEGGKRKTRRRRYQRKSRSRSNRKTKSQKKTRARKH